MLFNSYEFIFYFLPIIAGLYFLFRHQGRQRFAIGTLVAGSFFFYAWWNPPYLLIFLLSIAVNFYAGRRLSAHADTAIQSRRVILTAGIVFNLALLGYFKYTNFFLDTFSQLGMLNSIHLDILLPIGISFYTFQQIAFLVDSFKEKTNYNFLNYCLFVSFFPQLIAGPIVHHKEVMPQFEKTWKEKIAWDTLAFGILYFVIGLAKKVLIADNLASFATPVFNAADAGISVTFFEAWLGTMAYSMQLYFDFSGYSDMAIGLALMFGIRLPVNFDSPYKSKNIIEFWRRWHITLSTFLRDYLYIALGGNRKGKIMRYRNLLITMILGGLWHGAGWGFLIWGALHGLYLCMNHLYRYASQGNAFLKRLISPNVAWFITFLVAIIAWVPFRATNLDGALSLWASMAGQTQMGLPATLLGYAGLTSTDLGSFAWLFEGSDIIELQDWVFQGIPLIIGSTLIALFVPNSQQIVRWVEQCEFTYPRIKRLSQVLGATTAFVFLAALTRLNQATEFMYFQF